MQTSCVGNNIMEPSFAALIDERAKSDPAYETASSCLMAIRQAVKSENKQLTPILCFAGASATLRQAIGNGSQEVIAALIFIMRQCIDNVSKACLADQADLLGILCEAVKKFERLDLAKGALEICLALVNAMFDADMRPKNKLLKLVLPLLTDARNAVRHKSHRLILTTLRRCADRVDASTTVEFLTNYIVVQLTTAKVGGLQQDGLPVTHIVSLCEDSIKLFPNNEQVTVCKALVALAGKFGQHPLSAKVLDALSSFIEDYGSSPPSREILQVVVAPLVLTKGLGNAQGVDVLFGCACARILQATTIAAQKDGDDETSRKLLEKYLELFKSSDPSVLGRSSESVRDILQVSSKQVLRSIPELIGIPLLHAKYKLVYRWVFPVISGVFKGYARLREDEPDLERVDKFVDIHFPDIRSLVKALFIIRDSSFGRDYHIYGEDLDNCIGVALRTFGAQILQFAPMRLREVPFTDPNYEQKSRSWLLPLMAEHLRGTRMCTFCSDFLPEAVQLLALSKQCAREGNEVGAKKYRTLVDQIWELLPAYATEAVDLPQALTANGGDLAKHMCHVLVHEPSLRVCIAQALLAILQPLTASENASAISRKTCDGNIIVMCDYANRILPEMFTSYIKGAQLDGTDFCPKLLQSIQTYAFVIAPTPMLGNFYRTVVQRVLKSAQHTDTPVRETVALSQLAVTLLPALDKVEALALSLNMFSPLLHHKEGTVQKVAYKGMKTLYAHPKAAHGVNTPADLHKFWEIMAKSRDTCESVAIKHRLMALREFLTLVETCPLKNGKQEVYKNFLPVLLPEVMLRLREAGSQVRTVARECLQSLCAATFGQGLQQTVVNILGAGLSGNRLLKTHALDALSRLLYEHSSEMEEPLMDQIAEVSLALLREDRIVYRTVLKFCKVALYVFPDFLVAKHIKKMVDGIFASAHVLTSRMLVRKIVEKALKRLPFDDVAPQFPEKHKPLLTYISKQLEKRKRRKCDLQRAAMEETQKGFQQFMDEDEEVYPKARDPATAFLDAWEDGDKENKTSRKRKKAIALEIREDGDDIVDFFGADASANLVATTASDGAKRRRYNDEEEFKTGEDGRLLIEESDSDEEEPKPQKKDKPIDPKKSLSKLQALRRKRVKLVKEKGKKATQKKSGHSVQGLESFAPNKEARGDARKGNALEPYAYIRLNTKLYKEKHKHKAVASFSEVQKRGKHALKGRKAKVLLSNNKNSKKKTKRKR